jgi:glycosyltransferase involved in cell wall biosynthesis
MKLVIMSHKECWADTCSPTGVSTVGGFPFQMRAIADLFDETVLLVSVRHSPLPTGAIPLAGRSMRVAPMPEPAGDDLKRKLALLLWLPANLPHIWRQVRRADAVHAPVPGDLSTIGVLLALAQRKPLFVRHCGTWGRPNTISDRFLLRLLERIAGGRNVVMATGGAPTPPSEKNSSISWIFSTTLSREEMATLPPHRSWKRGEPLKLVTMGRLTAGKNAEAVIRALPSVREVYPATTLDVLGDGPLQTDLKKLTAELGVRDAVTFHGNLDHNAVMRVLASSQLFVFPTLGEGFPKSVLEAMACGLPVVATPVSVIPRLIEGGSGVLLPNSGYAGIVEAVTTLLNDEERLANMSAKAREASHAYTLEEWQETIRARLEASWGPLNDSRPAMQLSTAPVAGTGSAHGGS